MGFDGSQQNGLAGLQRAIEFDRAYCYRQAGTLLHGTRRVRMLAREKEVAGHHGRTRHATHHSAVGRRHFHQLELLRRNSLILGRQDQFLPHRIAAVAQHGAPLNLQMRIPRGQVNHEPATG